MREMLQHGVEFYYVVGTCVYEYINTTIVIWNPVLVLQ